MSTTIRATKTVQVGSVFIGSDHPVAVQSMTNTDTSQIADSVKQIRELAQAGSELVRLTVNTVEAAKAIPVIKDKLLSHDCHVPLIGDFHFNGHKLLESEPACAEALDKYRINPGNVGKGKKRDDQFASMIEAACRYDKPVRIGVNWGSLDQTLLAKLMDENSKLTEPLDNTQLMHQAVVTSALESAAQAIQFGLDKNKIILSCKMSGVQDLISVYQDLSNKCDYPLHLGLTEAGMGTKGIVASTAALAILLQQGIGNTIRISLTPKPNGNRCEEVIVAQEILQSIGLRAFTPPVIACPGCGRTSSTYFQQLAEDIQSHLRTQMPQWRGKHPGVETMQVAVMGCVVNGPGESKHANIGISLPGTGEKPVAPVYVDGKKTVTLKGDHIAKEFQQMVDDYVVANYKT